MSPDPMERITTLAFDMFGTVLDPAGSLTPSLGRFLTEKGASVDGATLWADWRDRQRIEQYQDALLMWGHSGYLETCRRALVYCLRGNDVEFTHDDVDDLMRSWQELIPFEDAVEALKRLGGRYRLVALSKANAGSLSTWHGIVSRSPSTPSSPRRKPVSSSLIPRSIAPPLGSWNRSRMRL